MRWLLATLLIGGIARADLQTPTATPTPKRSSRRASPRAPSSVLRVPQGTIQLPAGWIAVDEQGIDSRVGRVVDERGVTRLQYDIGFLAGRYVEQARGGWQQKEIVSGHELTYGQRAGTFYVTIDPFTNLWGAAATRADAERLMAIVRTLH
jgi:hypothetical protein